MPLATDIQAQISFKALITGTSHTSPLRSWFQEPFEFKPILYSSDVRGILPSYAETSSQADSFVSSNPTVAEKITLQPLTLVPGTNGSAFGLYETGGDTSSPVLGNWISPFDGSGPGYFPRFYRDAAGTDEITTSFGNATWFFHAQAGLLIWGGNSAQDNWSNAGVSEVYVTLYRYIGPSLGDMGVGGGGSSFVTFNQDKRVPSYGTLYMRLGKVVTASAPWTSPSSGTLTNLSVSVDRPDTKDYVLEVLKNDTSIAGLPLNSGDTESSQSYSVSFNASDSFQLRVIRQSGSGKSIFRNIVATMKIT